MDLIRKGKVMRRGQAQGGGYEFFQNANFCLKTQPLSLVINPVVFLEVTLTSFIF